LTIGIIYSEVNYGFWYYRERTDVQLVGVEVYNVLVDITDESRGLLGTYEALDRRLWNAEEFQSRIYGMEVNRVVGMRFHAGNER
jgi:hypothetical protein